MLGIMIAYLALISACIGVVSLVYTVILPYELLGNAWLRLLRRITNNREWLMKPLILCAKCWAGQVSLWGYLIYYFELHVSYTYSVNTPFVQRFTWDIEEVFYMGFGYSLPLHIFFICTSILTAEVFTYIYKNTVK